MHQDTFEKTHVLLIEDSTELRNSLIQILQSSGLGFSVEAVPSSVGFIARLVEGEADILLVDYDLAAGDPSIIVKTVKEIDPFLPIVLVSKNYSDHVFGEAARIGADSYIPLVGVPLKMLPMILSKRIEASGLLKESTDSRRESTLKSFQLDILSSLVRKMIESRDLRSVMQELAEQVVKKLDMKAVSLQRFLKEKNGFAVYGIYPQGKLLRFVRKFFDISSGNYIFPFDPASCIVDQYTADRRAWIGYDFADVFGTTMPSSPARMIQRFAGVESIYNAPFYSNDELLGGIVVGNARKNFTNEEIEAFNAIVHVSSLLFEYNESVNSQIVQSEKLKAIHEISIQLHDNLEPDKLFEVIYEKLDDLIPSDLVRLFLFEKEKRILRVERAVVKKGKIPIYVPKEIPLGKGLIGIAAAEKKSVLENNSHRNPLSYYIGEKPKLEHLLAVPVIHGAEVLGVISLTRWRSERFTESDLSALEIFSTQFAVALHNSQLFDSLARNEGLYRFVLQNVNDALVLVGRDRQILYVNRNFLKITGYEPGEVIGKEFDFLVHHEDRRAVGKRYKDRMNGKPAPIRYMFRFVKKSGEVGVAEYNVVTILDEGEITGILGVVRDITDDLASRSFTGIKPA